MYLFSCFLYVCPEPVLVNISHLHINGFKKTVFSPIAFVLFDIQRCRKRHSFVSCPYVCPEPVLVKRSLLYKTWTKSAVFRTDIALDVADPALQRQQVIRRIVVAGRLRLVGVPAPRQYICHASEIRTKWSPRSERPNDETARSERKRPVI